MRKWLTVAAMIAVSAGVALAGPGVAQATTTSCHVTWGSLPKSVDGFPSTDSPITNVRAGRHACFDRLVIDFAGSPSVYHVSYTPAVRTQARGDVLRLRGGAFLEIVALTGTNDINTGASTYNPRNGNELVNVRGWQTFRQAAFGGSFEGYTTVGLGVRARLPFRVFTLDRPGRIVIDVAHHW